ncbi:MAG: hypothetical protein IT376_20075 [Polyangiaceae bacterium]|nr:hypothetical protein [Polyangiaceae bacterium]
MRRPLPLPRRLPRRLATGLLALAGAAAASPALADRSTIRDPGNRPRYALELEPHLGIAAFETPGPVEDDGFGLGARVTFEVAPDGFIEKLNDSVGIGVGLDWIHYDGAYGRCRRYTPGPNGVAFCDGIDEVDADFIWLPVVMQWNFWLSRSWSVFGEPGVALRRYDAWNGETDTEIDPFVLYAGGRWHFAETTTLTIRLGWPTVSVGVSFLL